MKKLTQAGLAATGLFTFTMAAMAAQGALRTYYANDPVGRNIVMIESRAPLETMLIRTNQVTGDIHLDPQNILANPQARFEVDLASLDTGIALRNEHMKSEGWMNTAKYPKAVFTLTKVVPQRSAGAAPTTDNMNGKVLAFEAEGNLEMHGATHLVQAKIEVTPIKADQDTAQRLPGDLLHVRATFSIKLDAFGINVPGPAQLKVANEEQVTVDLFTSTELPKLPAAP